MSSLGYFPSLQDELLVIPMHPVVTRTSRSSIHSYHSRPSSRPITSGLTSWLHQMWYGEAGKHLADEDIVSEEGNGLGEDGVVVVQGGGNDSFVENGVGQDVDQEDLSLGSGKAKEVDGDFVGGGVQN